MAAATRASSSSPARGTEVLREKRRILQTVLTLHTGGLERIVVDLVNHASAEFEHWICCLEETGEMAQALSAKGVPLFELGKRPGIRPGLIRRIGDIVRDNGIDLVHTHNSAPAFYGGIAGRLAGRPVVHTKHGLNLFGQHLLNRVSYWFTDVVVAVSDSAGALATTEGVPAHRLYVVDNGVDVERFAFDEELRSARRAELGIEDGVFVVGSLGRLSAEKNHALLINAFADLAARDVADETLLLLAGDGPTRAELEAMAGELGLGPRVCFLGMVAHPEQFYPVLDVFVMPSRSEGLPVALLEAMAGGVPAVVTRVGAMPGVVDGCGVVVASEDRRGLAIELYGLMTDPARRKKLAGLGKNRILAQYAVGSMVATYESLYRTLLDGRPQPVAR
jgi:glycosyltransferase involved in cell wall biosynthesis